MNCVEKTKKENLIYKGRILDLYNDEVSLADGSESMRATTAAAECLQ